MVLVSEASSPLESLRSGKLDLALIPTVSLGGLKGTEKFLLFGLPFFFGNLKEVQAVQDGAAGDIMLSSLAEEKLAGLGFWNRGMTQLFTPSDKINSAEDLKGLRLGTSVSERSLSATHCQFADESDAAPHH